MTWQEIDWSSTGLYQLEALESIGSGPTTFRERNTAMGNIRIDVANVITIALVSFVGVWLINKGLAMAGQSQYAA